MKASSLREGKTGGLGDNITAEEEEELVVGIGERKAECCDTTEEEREVNFLLRRT